VENATDVLLEVAQVSKAFGVTQALDQATLSVCRGEVHALIGENGAGKSTLMKILSGAYRPDTGTITLDGQTMVLSNPLAARDQGIAMIYQELNLAPDLSVAENILLGCEPCRLGWVRQGKQKARAEAALVQLENASIQPETKVKSLTIAQQQLVEIARALAADPKVVIMDEPTSSLTQVDTQRLFSIIRSLRDRGVSVIYISHFLEECQAICDRFTVLRDGQTVGSGDMASTKLDHIVQLMVGREVDDIYNLPDHVLGEPVLSLKGVSGHRKPSGVSLELRRGEIFGLAGLVGAGRTETLRAVFGLDAMPEGVVHVRGHQSCSRGPQHRLKDGIGLLSENRKEEGLLLNRSVADNLTLSDYTPLTKWGWIRDQEQRSVTKRWIEELEVKTQGPSQAIGELSGGNQQKIAIGRLLHHDVEVLLLDEPTRGIDVGSKQQIYRLMGQLAAQGKAILFVSSYLPELLGVCDTIGVMSRGRLVATKPADDWTEHAIMSEASLAQEPSLS